MSAGESDGVWAPAHRVRASIASRERSASEVTRAALDRVSALQPVLNAFVDVLEDGALADAARTDELVREGASLPPLAGVPVVVKDNICTRAGRTTAGSRMLAGYRSPFDAWVVERLRGAGAVIIAKANMDEFGMGSSGEHSAHGPTKNPWDVARVPGGSSSGTAAAVAAGAAPIGLGTDTGGSIRQPAALCGLVGVRPTYGRVSRWGVVAFASSLDQVGPLARCAEDASLALEAIAGHDPRDSTSAELGPPELTSSLEREVRPLRIGVPSQATARSNHASVRLALDRTMQVLRGLEAELVEVELPHADAAIGAYYLVATAEASSNLARYDGVRYGHRAEAASLDELYERSRAEGFGDEVKRRIMLGTHALSSGYYDAYYLSALKARRLVKSDYDVAFGAGVHALLMPTTPEPAFELGAKTDDPLSMYLQDVYTVGPALAGLPAVSFQAGLTHENEEGEGAPRLPVGMQLVGPALSEAALLRIVRMIERVTDHHAAHPEL